MERLHTIRELQLERRLREKVLPADLFGEPAWDMLLDLAAHHELREPVPVSSLCYGACVPPTTALRYVGTLTSSGLAQSHYCPRDGRRRLITLSESGAVGMARFFERLEARRA